MKIVTIVLALAVIVLAYLLATRPEKTEYFEVSREMELLDSLALIRSETALLSTQKDSLVKAHSREKVAYKRTSESQRAEIRRLRAQIPDRIVVDTAFLAYEQALKEQRTTDSTQIVTQNVTIDSLNAISTAALTNIYIADKLHFQQIGMKEQRIAELTKSVKKEKRKKVLSQIAGGLAVVGAFLLSR